MGIYGLKSSLRLPDLIVYGTNTIEEIGEHANKFGNKCVLVFGGKSLVESRLSLVFNAFLKVPMQFLILAIGLTVVSLGRAGLSKESPQTSTAPGSVGASAPLQNAVTLPSVS